MHARHISKRPRPPVKNANTNCKIAQCKCCKYMLQTTPSAFQGTHSSLSSVLHHIKNRMCSLTLVLLHRKHVQVWLGILVNIDIWSLFTDFLSCSGLCIVEFKLLRTVWRWESEVWFGIPAFYYPISPLLFPPLSTSSSSSFLSKWVWFCIPSIIPSDP